MTLTCAHWFSVLKPRLVPPLFSQEAARRLLPLASALPGECQGVLEARLAPGDAPVDLSLRLLTASQARAMAELLPPPGRDFLLLWARPGGPLASVRSVWLEVDLDREPKGALDPMVCAKVPSGASPEWLLGTLLPSLLGSPLPAGQRGLILSCLEAMPASASLLYVFNLRARGSDAVRLEIFGMDPAGILDYLGRVAPPSVSDAAGIAPLFEDAERIHLSFDVTSRILPRIGIEGSFSRLPPREPRWLDLFQRLVQRGLCSPDKRDAALAWPGYDSFWTAPDDWPLGEARIRSVCARSLSHVKVVCRPDREPEAKVYLTFEPLERSAAGAASSPASRSVSCT